MLEEVTISVGKSSFIYLRNKTRDSQFDIFSGLVKFAPNSPDIFSASLYCAELGEMSSLFSASDHTTSILNGNIPHHLPIDNLSKVYVDLRSKRICFLSFMLP